MATKRPASERGVLLLATLVALGGIAGSAWVATSASAPDQPQIDVDVADRYGSLQGISANRTTTIERNGTVESTRTYAVQTRPRTGERRLSLVDGESRYDLRLSNGSVMWLYDRSGSTATRLQLGGVDREATRSERIARLFARLNATGGGDRPSADAPTVEPLPVVPEAPAGQGAAGAADAAAFGVSYRGLETVDDREVYVLHLAPTRDAGSGDYEQTLWIDTEHFYPLKQRTAWTHDGKRTVQTTTYDDVRFDPGIDDAAFAPEFPENTTVERPDTPRTTTYRDVAALRDATDVSVPEPDLPSGYELTYATRTTGHVQGVGLRYANTTSTLTVAKYNYTYAADGDAERVSVDGQPAELTRGQTVSLSWNCDRYRYTVRGTAISADAVVSVGDSVGCPGTGS